jgi:hypothetical protein
MKGIRKQTKKKDSQIGSFRDSPGVLKFADLCIMQNPTLV